jgi:tetratricopeptide (TPR) repeat protein
MKALILIQDEILCRLGS